MGVEREASDAAKAAKGRSVVDLITHHVSPETRARWTRRGLERIIAATPCIYPPNFKRTVQKAALKGGIVVAQNHMRNSDIPIGIRTAAEIMQTANEVLPKDQQLRGFVEPYAWSLENETQGEMSRWYADGIDALRKFGLETVPTPTWNDLRKGRVTLEVFKSGRAGASIRMGRAVLRDYKFILLAPEATVEGGEINPITGQINGMQEFEEDALYESLRIAARRTGLATLFTVSVSNSYGVLSSRNNKPTLRAALVGVASDRVFSVIPGTAKIMSATVNEPIEYTAAEVAVIGPSLINIRAGTTIARPLKSKERGFYGENL